MKFSSNQKGSDFWYETMKWFSGFMVWRDAFISGQYCQERLLLNIRVVCISLERRWWGHKSLQGPSLGVNPRLYFRGFELCAAEWSCQSQALSSRGHWSNRSGRKKNLIISLQRSLNGPEINLLISSHSFPSYISVNCQTSDNFPQYIILVHYTLLLQIWLFANSLQTPPPAPEGFMLLLYGWIQINRGCSSIYIEFNLHAVWSSLNIKTRLLEFSTGIILFFRVYLIINLPLSFGFFCLQKDAFFSGLGYFYWLCTHKCI